MFSFDLKNGYRHVDICCDHQTFLGFSWGFTDSSRPRYFVFTVLPFGLCTAPHIFTKCLKPLEKYWRLQGIRTAIFLDDGWFTENDYDVCKSVAATVRNALFCAGFIAMMRNLCGNQFKF